MLDFLKELNPTVSALIDSPVNYQDKIIGHHAVIVDRDQIPLGGGYGKSKEIARRIALAECLERAYFKKIQKDPLERLRFDIDSYPTTCGFAAGFDEVPTLLRAVYEAYERWIWEEWIDRKHPLPSYTPKMSELSEVEYFHQEFDSLLTWKLNFEIPNPLSPEKSFPLTLGICLGVKDNGVFPGSRVCERNENPWSHALLEAWRHLKIYQHTKDELTHPSLVDQRIIYFAQNKSKALAQISQTSTQEPWSFPRLKLLESLCHKEKSFFLYRAICEDLIGWQTGDQERFIY